MLRFEFSGITDWFPEVGSGVRRMSESMGGREEYGMIESMFQGSGAPICICGSVYTDICASIGVD